MAKKSNAFFSMVAKPIGKKLTEFFFGREPNPKPPSATIENRTAWRIVISRVNANGKSAAKSPNAGEAVANNETPRQSLQDLPVIVAPRPDRQGTPALQIESAPERLILAPFAKRLLTCAILNQYDYPSWEKRGFVQVCPELMAGEESDFATFVHVVAWVTLLVTLIATLVASPIALLVPPLIATLVALPAATLVTQPQLWTPWLYWLTLGLSAALVWYFDGATIGKWLSEVFNFLIIVLISLVLALGFYFVMTRDPSSQAPLLANRVIVQAGIAVVFFVVVVSSVPALLYYLFERQRSETTRAIFLRDIIRLNPSIYTLDEAEFRYGALADEVYGHKPSQDFLGGLQLSLLVNLALTTFGWSLALMPNVGHLAPTVTPYEAVPLLITPLRHPVVFGALGAYFFALNMLFRRYVRADLSAKAYTHVVMRQLITITLVWAVSAPTQLWANLGASGQDALLVLAFFVGIVPETALAALQDYLRNLKVLNNSIPSLYEDQPLDDLEGVTLYDRARLLEEGIENVENLAHHNLIDLMLRAHLPTPRLADLVDQAILYLHLYEPPPPASAEPEAPKLAEKQPADNKTPQAAGSQLAATVATNVALVKAKATNPAWVNPARAILRRYGIRTATDLEHARDLACSRGQTEVDNLLSLLDGEGQTPGRLQMVLDALEDDDWMPYLREWHWNRRSGLALTLEEIEDILLGLPTAKDKQALRAKEICAAPSPAADQVIAGAEPATTAPTSVVATPAATSVATATTSASAPIVVVDSSAPAL